MVANRTREMRLSGMTRGAYGNVAETPKQPSLRLRLRAPYLYPDRVYSAEASSIPADDLHSGCAPLPDICDGPNL
jgi:hypothetical protein